MNACHICGSHIGALLVCQNRLEQCASSEKTRPLLLLKGEARIVGGLARHIRRQHPNNEAAAEALEGLRRQIEVEVAIKGPPSRQLHPEKPPANNSVDRSIVVCAFPLL